MRRQIIGSAAAFAVLFVGTAPAIAKPPSDIADLVDARAAGGETQMQSRGYKMEKSRDGAQYWWNSGSNTCARIVVANGRYASVSKADNSDCGHGGHDGNGAAAAVAGIAAVGLIAALASHKKKHGAEPSAADHDSEYTRGYNDGLYGGQYDRHDSEGYHDGYMAGETEAANRRAGNRRYARGGPEAARQACERRGDEYQNAPAGSSVAVSQASDGRGNYLFTIATGHYRSRCTASANGNILDISPY